MVSHELRTPLNAILGWTELLLKRREDAALRERGLEIIGRNARLQTQLISDLLDISRIVAGKLRLDIQSVDLASLVEGAIETVEDAAKAKSIRIDRDLDASIGPMAGDPARLQQVVWNLLSNALKFTPKGGRVRVTLRQSESQAEIVVQDDGAGIRADFLPYVFDRFQQADASRARRFGGLGLGLSIVRNLVQFHGGIVRAESEGEGHGATFTVALPQAAPPLLREDALGPAASKEGITESVSLARIRVLVVEDEPDAAEFVKQLLEGCGAAVVTATCAQQALQLLGTIQPDILISDIGLPEIDGYQLLELVRQTEGANRGGIPAIALTAFARSEDRRRALLAGYQAHLAKPIEAAELVATVASFAELVKTQRTRASDGR
jgi:CheY-like chemotaxis protein/two-component sensor histidine kinase